MKLSKRPVAHYRENRFVLTEDEAWFVPYRREFDWPPMADILAAVLDLGVVAESFIVGSYFPPKSMAQGAIGEVFAVQVYRERSRA